VRDAFVLLRLVYEALHAPVLPFFRETPEVDVLRVLVIGIHDKDDVVEPVAPKLPGYVVQDRLPVQGYESVREVLGKSEDLRMIRLGARHYHLHLSHP